MWSAVSYRVCGSNAGKIAPYAWPGRAALQTDLTRPLGRMALAGNYLEFPNMYAAMRSGNEAARRVDEVLSP